NSEERVAGRLDADIAAIVTDVRLDAGLPVWEYQCEGARIEKRVLMPYRQNTVHVTYRLLDGPPTVQIELRPAVHFRGSEDRGGEPDNSPLKQRYAMAVSAGVHLLTMEGSLPPLRLQLIGGADQRFTTDERVTSEFLYPVEESRGYEFRGTLWTPGEFEVTVA